MSGQLCCHTKWGGFGATTLCRNRAAVEHEGRHYCGVHNPVRKAEKQEAYTAALHAKWDSEAKQRAAKQAADAERDRRAALYPELLEALQDLIRELVLSDVDLNYMESHFRPWLNKAYKAINKAGATP